MNSPHPIQDRHPFWRTFLGGLLFALISEVASAVARIKFSMRSAAPPTKP